MTEAMTDDRLEDLRSHLAQWYGFDNNQGAELIAEVDRLRGEVNHLKLNWPFRCWDCEQQRPEHERAYAGYDLCKVCDGIEREREETDDAVEAIERADREK